jgi:hypothetical protein
MMHQVPRTSLTPPAVAGQLERPVRPAAGAQRTGRTRDGVVLERLKFCARCAGSAERCRATGLSLRSSLRWWRAKEKQGRSGALNGEDQRCLTSEGTSGKGEPRAASRDEDNQHCSSAGLTFELSRPRRQAAYAWYAMMHHVPRTRLTLPAVAGRLERGVRPHLAHLRACSATDDSCL